MQGVVDAHVIDVVFLLQLYCAAEEIQPAQRRLAALKAKGTRTLGMGQGFADHGFQHILGHQPVIVYFTMSRFIGIKAVAAAHIAAAGGRFDQQIERRHGKPSKRYFIYYNKNRAAIQM